MPDVHFTNLLIVAAVGPIAQLNAEPARRPAAVIPAISAMEN
jgi:hypothetical protein